MFCGNPWGFVLYLYMRFFKRIWLFINLVERKRQKYYNKVYFTKI